MHKRKKTQNAHVVHTRSHSGEQQNLYVCEVHISTCNHRDCVTIDAVKKQSCVLLYSPSESFWPDRKVLLLCEERRWWETCAEGYFNSVSFQVSSHMFLSRCRYGVKQGLRCSSPTLCVRECWPLWEATINTTTTATGQCPYTQAWRTIIQTHTHTELAPIGYKVERKWNISLHYFEFPFR